MRVVLIRRESTAVPDGINAFLFALSDRLLAEGHEVCVVSTWMQSPREILKYCDVRNLPRLISITRLRAGTRAFAAARWAIRGSDIVNSLRPDIVLVNGAVLAKFDGVTCILCHDVEERGRYWGALRLAYKRRAYGCCDVVAVTCTELARPLSRELRIPERSILLLPTCVDPQQYRCAPVEERTRAILHVGTSDYKNPAASVRAFAALNAPGVELLLVGQPTASLTRQISKLNGDIRRRVRLSGLISRRDLTDLLSRVVLASIPSVYAVPVASPTALEALASGTPVVGSPSISADILVDNVNGFRVPPDDPQRVAERFSSLMSDPALWRRMSDAGRTTAAAFAPEKAAARLLHVIAGRRTSLQGGLPG